MFNNLIFLLACIFISNFGFGQNCDLTIKGQVVDDGSGEPLEAVNIYIQEIKGGTISEWDGSYQLDGLCEGDYHLVFSHIGCESKRIFLNLNQDTMLNIDMDHSAHVLHDVEITSNASSRTIQQVSSLHEQSISDQANENLSNMLESISGVTTIRNGSGISKPVVHGLYGNRLTILNNGIAQSGQQWGSDHSPEIDPLVANKIKVIKGTSSLEYMGSNLGSVILVEPQSIELEPHLHGRASYFFETNGMGNGWHLQLQKHSEVVAWKVNGTLKKNGDKSTPDYYLNNTGSQEANMAIQLEKQYNDRWFTNFYVSSFNTELGVLRGSHVGNLTDLETAFNREVPFFTEENSSYNIDAPKQKVHHTLAKLNAKYFFTDQDWIEFTSAGQYNNRKEFDVRRSGRSDVPALSLQQFSFFNEAKYTKEFDESWTTKSGLQLNIINNTNNPETGILPLVPDYLAYESGAFITLSKTLNKSIFEGGFRLDHTYRDIALISNTIPREVIRYAGNFTNLTGSMGWSYAINAKSSLSYNIGYATRNPAVNELYSGGLHQGVSGIEEGNILLSTEKSIKTTLGYNANILDRISFESLVYYQKIDDYIFLDPTDEIRLTIRGAFPVFQYQQTDAEIYGWDLSTKLQLSSALDASVAYSYIKGNDVANHIPLVNMPANSLTTSISFEVQKVLKFGKNNIENFNIAIENKIVGKQNNLLSEQDFVVAPDGYNLLGFKASADVHLSDISMRWTAKVDNALNVAYRDYLNRQRYFSDDLGINFVFGLNVYF